MVAWGATPPFNDRPKIVERRSPPGARANTSVILQPARRLTIEATIQLRPQNQPTTTTRTTTTKATSQAPRPLPARAGLAHHLAAAPGTEPLHPGETGPSRTDLLHRDQGAGAPGTPSRFRGATAVRRPRRDDQTGEACAGRRPRGAEKPGQQPIPKPICKRNAAGRAEV